MATNAEMILSGDDERTDGSKESKGPDGVARRKRRISTGAVSKGDFESGMAKLSASIEKSFEGFAAKMSNEIIIVRGIAEEAKSTADRAASSTSDLAKEVHELRAQVRQLSLTPPTTPRATGSAPASTQVNPRRYVVLGFKDKTHRTDILERMRVVLATASSSDMNVANKLIDHQLIAPQLRGKVGLVDVAEESPDLLPLLVPHFAAAGLVIKKDRPESERTRSGQIVAVAKTVDALLESKGQTKGAEICWSTGIVWLKELEVCKYRRDLQRMIWGDQLHTVFDAAEISRIQSAYAPRRG